MRNRTEDQVRDGALIGSAFVPGAKQILGFDKPDTDVNAQQGTGQITTFNQLGFSGIDDRPDGWYLPIDIGSPAIILETKGEKIDLNNKKWVKELFKNIDIVSTKYSKVIGILYNGTDVRIFRGHEELFDLSKDLEHKSYYIKLFTEQKIDKKLNRIIRCYYNKPCYSKRNHQLRFLHYEFCGYFQFRPVGCTTIVDMIHRLWQQPKDAVFC